jgi:hypothetical protein
MRSANYKHGRVFIGLAICALAFGPVGHAIAQQAANLPLLEELSRQTESLYHAVSPGVVRVQLPTTRPSTQPGEQAAQDPLARWDSKLTPEVRARLRQNPESGVAYVAEIIPVPGPTIAAPGNANVPPTPPPVPAAHVIVFTPNVLGVVFDAQGHALLPMFVPAANIGDKPLTVLLCDGTVTQARFVGSDRQSNLTVVQVLHGVVRPLPFSAEAPAEGALVMMMSMDPAATRLSVWTRWTNNQGLVIRTDGSVAGFSQRGGFLSGAACAPVVRQLIQHGHVDRPRLGVVIRDVDANDPLRQLDAVLGQTPAIRIWNVIAGSPADQAGLHVGDLILKLGGQPVGDVHGFAAAIAALHGPTDMQILRQDQTVSVKVNLESQSSN